MQGLTDPPRDAFTADQITALLTSRDIQVTAGCDLLDTSNTFVDDISADLQGGEVDRDCYADVHGTCKLNLMRELAWGKDRVRPWMTLSDGAITARFNLGVFVMTTPETKRGETPITYDVTGFDLLYLLQAEVGDTYVVTADGTKTYLQAIRDAVTASGVGATVLLAGDAQNTALPADMVWCLSNSSPVTYLRILNDLLAAINYRGIWADPDGNLRSGPYATPSTRPVEWAFDTSDEQTDLLNPDRTLSQDVWGVPNWWRFVRNRMTTQPTEGAGLYTVTNQSDGPTSIDQLGRTVRKVAYLDAADQTSLQSQGDRIVDQDRQVARTFDLSVDPLPIAGHFDVVTLTDAGSTDKCQVASWAIPLDGSPGQWHLEAVNG